MDGILALDKDRGISSNQILQKVKRLFKAKKAGHTGTLDPLATGLMLLCFGRATKLSSKLLLADKKYLVTAQCGVTTTTGDSEGDVVENKVVPAINNEQLTDILALYIGKISQIPPMYSALKYKGKPLYTYARKGIEIEREPRSVCIHSIKLHQITDSTFTIEVFCSKGTYIRTLIEDIGKSLGYGAHVTDLRRLSIGDYDVSRAFDFATLENMSDEMRQETIISLI